MGSEGAAYGYSLGCISRRQFLIYMSLIGACVCVFQIVRWLLNWSPLYSLFTGHPEAPIPGCIGEECSAVFTCLGLKETSLHIRQPLTTLAGVVFLPIGYAGANNGFAEPVKYMGYYLAAAFLVQLGVLVGDIVYYNNCNAYSFNVVDWTLMGWSSPLGIIQQERLQRLQQQVETPLLAPSVDAITNDFRTMFWYKLEVAIWLAALFYAAKEALTFGWLRENGPVGLGIWFGLGQWDEVMNLDNVRIMKEKDMRSQFFDDANLPLMKPVEDASRGYPVRPGKGGAGYGAVFEDLQDYVESGLQRTTEAAQAFSVGVLLPKDDNSEDATQAPASMEKVVLPRSDDGEAEADDYDGYDSDEEYEAEVARMLAERLAIDEAAGY